MSHGSESTENYSDDSNELAEETGNGGWAFKMDGKKTSLRCRRDREISQGRRNSPDAQRWVGPVPILFEDVGYNFLA